MSAGGGGRRQTQEEGKQNRSLTSNLFSKFTNSKILAWNPGISTRSEIQQTHLSNHHKETTTFTPIKARRAVTTHSQAPPPPLFMLLYGRQYLFQSGLKVSVFHASWNNQTTFVVVAYFVPMGSFILEFRPRKASCNTVALPSCKKFFMLMEIRQDVARTTFFPLSTGPQLLFFPYPKD